MRIVTFEHPASGWRVGYRWADDPLAPPRLLMDSNDAPLPQLRRMLERDIFGESMSPGAYQIIALVQDDSEVNAVRAAFNGLDVIGVPRDTRTLAILGNLLEPNMLFDPILALTYWQTAPQSFGTLFDQLDSSFIVPFADLADDPVQMRNDFVMIRTSVRSALIGQSVRAMRDTCARLIGASLQMPLRPVHALLHTDTFCGLSFSVIDLRAPKAIATLAEIPLLILAVTSDPGLGAAELAALEHAERAVIVLINTHTVTDDYVLVRDYVRAQIGETMQVVDEEEIQAEARANLGAVIRQRLFDWLEAHFSAVEAPDNVQASIRRVHHWIKIATSS